MTRDELDQQNTAILRKWTRTLSDRDGDPPRGVLDELAGVAIEYAASTVPLRADGTAKLLDDLQRPATGTRKTPQPAKD